MLAAMIARQIDRLPLLPVAAGALLLGLAPFSPEPHLVQKLWMLFEGDLSSPVDVFDLVFHGSLPLLLVLKLARLGRSSDS